MQIQDITVNDTAVLNEDNIPVVSINIDVSILCDGDLSAYETSGGLDTTTLKDEVVKTLRNHLLSKQQ